MLLLTACGDDGNGAAGRVDEPGGGGPATTGTYEEGTVAGVLSRDGRFTRLLRILEAAEVRVGPPPGTVTGTAADEMGRAGWDHTLFAPTDDAFDKLADGDLESLFQPGAAIGFVRTHIVPEVIPVTDLQTGELVTVAGTVPITAEGSEVRVAGALIVEADVEASNGIIHVLDAVIPSSAS